MKKQYQSSMIRLVELKKTDVVSTSSPASAPSAIRESYGTASVEDGTSQTWD